MATEAVAASNRTIARAAADAAERRGDRVSVRYRGGEEWRELTFAEVAEIVDEIALGLVSLGVERGDRVALLANTRPEWTFSSLAISRAGAVVVPIYPTNSPEECEWVVGNSDSRIVICEDAGQAAKIEQVGRPPRRPRARAPDRCRCSKMPTMRRSSACASGPRRRPLRARAPLRGGLARRSVHDHLHLGHDRTAEGRRAQPRELCVGRGDVPGDRVRHRRRTLSYLYLPLAHSVRADRAARVVRRRNRDRVLGRRHPPDHSPS